MRRHTIQCYIGRKVSPEVVKSMLDDYPEIVNLRDARGRTCLHFAAHTRGRKADVNARTENDNTPLHEAISAFEFNHDIINLLLANGADPHAMNKKGQTPLQIVPGRNRKYLEQFCRQRLQT